MKCLVTGATGFIGSELCQQLARRGASLEQTGREAPSDRQLDGIRVVFHTAGIAHRRATSAEYEACNYRPTLALAARANRAGVARFVFLSSVNADPEGEPYGYWKWRTEQELMTTYAEQPMAVVVVRPALVYGPGVAGNLLTLMRAVRLGAPAPPAGPARSMIALPDLCELLCLMIDVDPGRGSIFCATDGEAYDLERMHRAFRAALGREPGRAWLPLWCWRTACGLSDLLRLRPVGDTFSRLFGGEVFSNAALRNALDWRPRHRLEDLAPAMLEAVG